MQLIELHGFTALCRKNTILLTTHLIQMHRIVKECGFYNPSDLSLPFNPTYHTPHPSPVRAIRWRRSRPGFRRRGGRTNYLRRLHANALRWRGCG